MIYNAIYTQNTKVIYSPSTNTVRVVDPLPKEAKGNLDKYFEPSEMAWIIEQLLEHRAILDIEYLTQ